MRRSLAAVVVVLMAAGCATLGAAAPGSVDNPASISWKVVRQAEGSTFIDGSLLASFGLFILTWRIDSKGNVTLADEQPSGTGEMPIYDKTPLYPWLPGDGKSYIFRVRIPVLGSRDPVSLHLAAVVREDDLLAGLSKALVASAYPREPNGVFPPVSKAPDEVSEWKASGLAWRLPEKGEARLYRWNADGTPQEVFPWISDYMSGMARTGLVFEIATHSTENINLKFLKCHSKVDTAQMLSAR